MALLLLLMMAPPESSIEARFVEALKADLAAGKPERTLALLATAERRAGDAGRLAPFFASMRRYGPVMSLERDPATPFVPRGQVRFTLKQERAETRVLCALDAAGKIAGYRFVPVPPKWSMDRITRAVEAWPGDAAFFIERYEDDTGVGEGSTGHGAFPLGSVFKIAVLGALDEARIDAGRKVKIREEWKSFPPGVLHLRRAGTAVTVDELASKMVALDDNTAADHLIHLLGRLECERCMPHQRLNSPMLLTREVFLARGGGRENATKMSFAQLCRAWPQASRERRLKWIEAMTAPFEKRRIEDLLAPVAAGCRERSRSAPGDPTFGWFAPPESITSILMEHWLDQHETFLKYYAMGAPVHPGDGLEYCGSLRGGGPDVMALSALVVSKKKRAIAICIQRKGALGDYAAEETARIAATLVRWGLETKLFGE